MLDAPDPATRDGIRDRAMLYLGFTAGLRVSEIVGLRMDDVSLEETPQHPRATARGAASAPAAVH